MRRLQIRSLGRAVAISTSTIDQTERLFILNDDSFEKSTFVKLKVRRLAGTGKLRVDKQASDWSKLPNE
jgi:hypothetical protein